MDSAWTLAFAAAVPFLCLGLLLWLARLEETLTDGLPGVQATLEPATAAAPAPSPVADPTPVAAMTSAPADVAAA